MKLSKKGRYGLKALVDLSVNSKNSQVSLSSIAERNSISSQYLEQIFSNLKKAGIIKSKKGPQGGYFLAKDAGKITVADVLESLEGGYEIESEVIAEDTPQAGISSAIQVLVIDKVNQKLSDYLNQLTLEDLENFYMSSKDSDGFMYYI